MTESYPQGSGYGPDLWIYAVNPLLLEDLPGGKEIVTYTDDLPLLVSRKNRAELTLLKKATLLAKQHKFFISASLSQTLWLKVSLSKPLERVTTWRLKNEAHDQCEILRSYV